MINERKKMSKSLIAGVVLLVGASFFAGILVSNKTDINLLDSDARLVNKDVSKSRDLDFNVFWEVWDILDSKYFEQPVSEEDRFYGSLRGMVDSLEDPYTVFMDPDETRQFEDDLDGSFQGIGIEIGLRDEILTVISPLDNSPADRAGILAGDKILAIDGDDTAGITLNEAVERIRGEKGSTVTLTILREDEEATQDIEIVRDDIEVASVSYEIRDDVATISISRFGDTTVKEFDDAVSAVQEKNIDRIILDLRNNPGGFLQSAIEISSRFMDSGTVAIQEFADGHKKVFDQTGASPLADSKVVILVNGGSASASEIVAGALRDNRDIQIIGEKTFGKGSVQEVELLSDGSSLRVTVAKWLTPNGQNLNENGLDPNIEIELTSEDIKAERDPQLNRALQVVRGL